MSARKRMSWATLLGNVPKSEPPPVPANDENIFQLPSKTLSEMEEEGKALSNTLLDKSIDLQFAVKEYETARKALVGWQERMLERLKELGIKGEFPMQYPEAELMDKEE